MVGLVCSPAIAGSSSDGCPLFGKLERRLYQQTGDGSPNTMASSSIDSLVENDGRVGTFALVQPHRPQRLCLLESRRGLSPTARTRHGR